MRQALKGYRRSGQPRDSRRPVLFDILKGVFEQLLGLYSSEYGVSLFRVAFSLAFYGTVRISELISPSKKVQGGILASEVLYTEKGVSLVLCRSKKDQARKGKTVQVSPITCSPLCPVGAMQGFLEVRCVAEGSFLMHADGSPLSKQ